MPINQSMAVEISYLTSLLKLEETRQAMSENRLLMYREDFEHILRSRIYERVSDVTQKKINPYIHARLNPLKSIIDEISDIYLTPPVRTIEGTRANAIQDVYDRIDIDSLMDIVNAHVNLLNDILLYVVKRTDKKTGKEYLDVDILTPNVVTILADSNDPTKIIKVFIKRKKEPDRDFTPDNTYWVVWSDDEHYKMDGHGTVTAIEGNEELINPWGVLPFVVIHRKRPIDTFWNSTGGKCLYEFSIQINIDDIMDRFTRFWNSFKTMAFTGESVQVKEGAILSPDHAVVAEGENVAVQVLDFQVNFESLNKDKESNLEMISREFGVDAGNYGRTQEASGRALLIKNDKLSRIRETQQKIFDTAENDLFSLINRITGIMNGDSTGDESTTFEIKYSEAKTLIEPKEELEIKKEEIEMNLADIVDVFMEMNPGFSGNYEEAKKRLIEIHKSNNEFRQMIDEQIMSVLNSDENKEKQ